MATDLVSNVKVGPDIGHDEQLVFVEIAGDEAV